MPKEHVLLGGAGRFQSPSAAIKDHQSHLEARAPADYSVQNQRAAVRKAAAQGVSQAQNHRVVLGKRQIHPVFQVAQLLKSIPT